MRYAVLAFVMAILVPTCARAVVHPLAIPGVDDARITCDTPGGWAFSSAVSEEAGAQVVELRLSSPSAARPPEFKLEFSKSGAGADHVWSPWDDRYMLYPNQWDDEGRYVSQLAYRAPVVTAFGDDGRNALAISCSDAFRKVRMKLAIKESSCVLRCFVRFFSEFEPACTGYTVRIRLDTRRHFWADAVREAADWVSAVNSFVPCRVPEAAYDPVYSTWYAFWQDVRADVLEREMPIARSLGMRTAILDDGWQKGESATFYSATGDWLPVKSRFPDMKAHVARVHDAGIKYLLWLSVPYVGDESAAWKRFEGRFLKVECEDMNPGRVGVLDPRYPDVREYLVSTFERCVRDWDLDGLKLDFIDLFRLTGEDPAEKRGYAGCDYRSMPEAVDVLMKETVRRLQALKPDILLEFRQQYMGPAIRQYGNMIRASDCPADHDKIRKLVADLRLTSGTTPVHSDMLAWSPDESPERAARPILDSLFSVIQYSMVLERIPPAHKEVIRHWLAFSQEHRDTLLKGEFRPYHPELLYPRLEASSASERIIALYSTPSPVDLRDERRRTYLVNATSSAELPVHLAAPRGVRTFDVFGKQVAAVTLPAGLSSLPIPPSGYAEFE